jgi:hypothetical protein
VISGFLKASQKLGQERLQEIQSVAVDNLPRRQFTHALFSKSARVPRILCASRLRSRPRLRDDAVGASVRAASTTAGFRNTARFFPGTATPNSIVEHADNLHAPALGWSACCRSKEIQQRQRSKDEKTSTRKRFCNAGLPCTPTRQPSTQ